jgi:hypothetical protein
VFSHGLDDGLFSLEFQQNTGISIRQFKLDKTLVSSLYFPRNPPPILHYPFIGKLLHQFILHLIIAK